MNYLRTIANNENRTSIYDIKYQTLPCLREKAILASILEFFPPSKFSNLTIG